MIDSRKMQQATGTGRQVMCPGEVGQCDSLRVTLSLSLTHPRWSSAGCSAWRWQSSLCQECDQRTGAHAWHRASCSSCIPCSRCPVYVMSKQELWSRSRSRRKKSSCRRHGQGGWWKRGWVGREKERVCVCVCDLTQCNLSECPCPAMVRCAC